MGLINRVKGRTQMAWLAMTGPVFVKTQDGYTAHAGGTKAAATVLNPMVDVHRISVCATNGDSILLPPAVVGRDITIINDGAANAQLFGQSTDTIDAVATATGVVMSAAKRGTFTCSTAGAWQSNAGAKTT